MTQLAVKSKVKNTRNSTIRFKLARLAGAHLARTQLAAPSREIEHGIVRGPFDERRKWPSSAGARSLAGQFQSKSCSLELEERCIC